MSWVCHIGVCPNPEIECEECEHYKEEDEEFLADRDYKASVDYIEHCQTFEPTYNPEDGSM